MDTQMTEEESLIYEAARLEAINRKLKEQYAVNEHRIAEIDKKLAILAYERRK